MTALPPPLIEIAVAAASPTDDRKIASALARIAAEDPSLRVQTDAASGKTVLRGMSEPHLAAVIGSLARDFGIATRMGAPQVLYRETIARAAHVDYTHKKLTQTGGQFARVALFLAPLPPGGGVAFENAAANDALPDRFLPAIEAAARACLAAGGVLAGCPVTDIKVTLTNGAWHDVDSSLLAFDIATRAALREGLPGAEPLLLEPVMRIEVVTPPDLLVAVLADLNGRRGEITSRGERGSAALVHALVPLASLFGYSRALKELARSRAGFSMQFSHYAPVPTDDDPRFSPPIGPRA